MRFKLHNFLALGCFALAATGVHAQDDAGANLFSSSLEDLTQMQISVSSFARKAQDVNKTPAAVYVITQEQIEHSAANSIPDLLRMVPGIQVAQINASIWAVTARGFNNQFENKLLVLVDGRTIYSEIFAGVNWDEIDLPLEDLERIEVVRGPGASMWGTSAANGVINIITKRSHSKIGTGGSWRMSNLVQSGAVSYGGALGEKAQFDAGLQVVRRSPLKDATGQNVFDGEFAQRFKANVDWQHTWKDLISFTGEFYRGNTHVIAGTPDAHSWVSPLDHESFGGGVILGRWEHKGKTGEMTLQAYYSDLWEHLFHGGGLTQTADVDFHNHVTAGSRHDLVWGGEFRFTADHGSGNPRGTISSEYNNYLISGFLQDDITLVPGKLVASLGSRFSRATLSGVQVQPTARLLWSPTERQTVWIGISHAAVAISVAEIGLDHDSLVGSVYGMPLISMLDGNPNIKPEFLDSIEAGYRLKLTRTLSLDTASYYNRYTRITSVLSGDPGFSSEFPGAVTIPGTFVNGYEARTAGFEAALAWKPVRSLDLHGAYTWMQAHGKQVLPGLVSIVQSWSSPRNSGSISATWNLTHGWTWNGFLSYVQALSDTSSSFHGFTPGQQIPGYARLDTHLSHRFGRHLEFDAGGLNLTRSHHVEFGDNSGFAQCNQVPRSFFLKGKVTF